MSRPVEYRVPATSYADWCGTFQPAARLDWQTPALAWDDATTPRTATPVRFQFRRVSVWCDPRPVFAAVTWTEELRTLGYYRKVN